MSMRGLVVLVVAALAPACASTGYRGLWQPKPVELTVTGEQGQPVARLSAAVLGQWRGDPDDGEVHVRLRVENVGETPLRVPLDRIEMLSGDLQPFGRPRLVGGADAEVPPGATGSMDVGCMPPAEDPDLRGLQLRWVVLLDGRELPGSATFQYFEPTYYDPFYPRVHLGFGYGIHSHWDWDPWCSGPVFSPPVQTLPPHVTTLPGKP